MFKNQWIEVSEEEQWVTTEYRMFLNFLSVFVYDNYSSLWMLCLLFCPTALCAAAFQVHMDHHMDADSKISIS